MTEKFAAAVNRPADTFPTPREIVREADEGKPPHQPPRTASEILDTTVKKAAERRAMAWLEVDPRHRISVILADREKEPETYTLAKVALMNLCKPCTGGLCRPVALRVAAHETLGRLNKAIAELP